MANAAKTAAVAELAEAFRGSSAAVLTEYRGLTVAQLKELRRTVAADVTYAVVKNTLTKLAARDAGVPSLDALLQGPSAIAFVTGDPVAVAKGIRDFARTHPLLVVKGGVLEGRGLTADEIRRLADLESRAVLLARLAGALQASLGGAIALVAAPLSQAARLLAALQARAEEDPSVLAPVGTPPAAAVSPTADVLRTTGQVPPTTGEVPPTTGEVPEPVETAPTVGPEEPATTSGDAADAAVAADALAREVAAEEAVATPTDPPADQPDEAPPA